jgi:RNA polymerase sigma-70 factor (ECF subfamily)
MALDQQQILRSLLQQRATLFAYVLSIVGDYALAEDVFQDVSLLAMEKRGEIRSAGALPAWLRKAARFKALQAIERQQRQPIAVDGQVLDLLEPHWQRFDEFTSQDMAAMLQACLGRLTPRSRELVDLRYGQSLKTGDVARKLGRKVESVYVALVRIHRQLAECMQRRLTREVGDA